ncbi:DUF3995 domain-containing protein [Glycomyces luteolus]|uniref:DUF3995 domain-containing protein n=1 Tax=Glycomyces luteolus TaxID=2670330 RepID=A0A9X3PCX9_9ACTN|nr:DUF3995 domain-containing protein [Glycomyces luteolus]MDA1361155.1 DUF3995 domain-containing protein [Glycomyces luteolus]
MTVRHRKLAYAVESVLIADAAFHLLWATGSTWPAADVRTLSYALLGAEVSFAPGLLLALAALALTTLAVIHCRARVERCHRLYPLLQAGALAFLAFVSVRALAGLIWALGVGAAADHADFHRLNLFAYTPLCLAMAAAVFTIVRSGAKPLRSRAEVAHAKP